jgi:hypothetical protein
MKYCMKCGVKIDENKHTFCPLCKTIILSDRELEQLTKEGYKASQKSVFESLQIESKIIYNKLGLSAFILFFLFLLSILTLLIIDFSGDRKITWSLFPIVSIIAFDSILNLTFLNEDKTNRSIVSLVMFILMGYFLSINYLLSGNMTWSYYINLSLGLILLSLHILKQFHYLTTKIILLLLSVGFYVLLLFVGPYGNPVINYFLLGLNAFVFVTGLITYYYLRTYSYNKYLIIAILSISFSIFIKGLEMLLNWHLAEGDLNFSFYVIVILIPIAIVMFLLNNQRRVMDYIKKKFHI